MATRTVAERCELFDGLRQGVLLGAAVLVLVIPPWRGASAPVAARAPLATATAAAPTRQLDLRGEALSAEARWVSEWVVRTADNGALPFAIVDKRDARVYVFEAAGRLSGATPVLLGYAAGDDSVPGIGQRAIADVKPQERTTPAGRFVAEPGRNAINEEVVWVDYGAAVSMHRVRLNNPLERRLERLRSPSASERRISFGCINMPVAFFDNVLWPRFSATRGIVYVLPEVKPLVEVFPGVRQGAAPADSVSRSTARTASHSFRVKGGGASGSAAG